MSGPAIRLLRYATVLMCVVLAGPAWAVEYALQFAPAGNYEDLVVAGYQIAGKTVVGNCSYTAITSGSGRDPRTYYTPVPLTCTWNLYGALLGAATGAPVVPSPLGVDGTETIYARKSARVYTGSDSALSVGGFVFTYGAHDDWLTSNAYMVLPPQTKTTPYTFTATLMSNGDIPLDVTAVSATSALAGQHVTLDGTSCVGRIAVGSTCDVTVSYADYRLTSPSGLAYDSLTIHLVSNAGVTDDFVQHYTDEVRVPTDPP